MLSESHFELFTHKTARRTYNPSVLLLCMTHLGVNHVFTKEAFLLST